MIDSKSLLNSYHHTADFFIKEKEQATDLILNEVREPLTRIKTLAQSIIDSQQFESLDSRKMLEEIITQSTVIQERSINNLKNRQQATQFLTKEFSEFSEEETKLLSQLQAIEFAHNLIMHDVRVPLSNIRGIAQLLLEDIDLNFEDRLEFLEALVISSDIIIKLADSQNKLTKLESGADCLEITSFNLLELVKEISKALTSDLRPKKEVCLNIENDYLIFDHYVENFKGDQVLIRSMLTNLIKNALEALPPGYDKIDITLWRDNEYLALRIHNMGAIPIQIRDSFFNKYQTAGKANGTGLGAYTAKLIATRHYGRIDFTSDEINGTKITVRLPY